MRFYNREDETMISVFEKISNYKEYYRTKFGELKFLKVENKVNSHRGLKKIIAKSETLNSAPSGQVYIHTLMSKPFFMVANADTVLLGAILCLEKWHFSQNQGYVLLDEYEIDIIYREIREYTDKMRFLE